MKPVHILGAIGVLGILAMGAWYLYMQQAPLPAAETGGGATNQRGLDIPTGTAKAKPKAATPKAPEAPKAPAATDPAKAPAAPPSGTAPAAPEGKAPAAPAAPAGKAAPAAPADKAPPPQ